MSAELTGEADRDLARPGPPTRTEVHSAPLTSSQSVGSAMLNKVPEVTLLFWIVKMMSTTVGETGADLLSGTLGWGMPLTTAVVTVLLIGSLVL